MTDVKISPNAASIHVEGDIGGGSSPVITVVGITLVTPVEEIISMYNNHTFPSVILHKSNEDDTDWYLSPITYFNVSGLSGDNPIFTIQANDLTYVWEANTPYLSYTNVTVTNYDNWEYVETPVVKYISYDVKNLDYPD